MTGAGSCRTAGPEHQRTQPMVPVYSLRMSSTKAVSKSSPMSLYFSFSATSSSAHWTQHYIICPHIIKQNYLKSYNILSQISLQLCRYISFLSQVVRKISFSEWRLQTVRRVVWSRLTTVLCASAFSQSLMLDDCKAMILVPCSAQHDVPSLLTACNSYVCKRTKSSAMVVIKVNAYMFRSWLF